MNKSIFLVTILLITSCSQTKLASEEQIDWCVSKALYVNQYVSDGKSFPDNAPDGVHTDIVTLSVDWDKSLHIVMEEMQKEVGNNIELTYQDILFLYKEDSRFGLMQNDHYYNMLVSDNVEYLNDEIFDNASRICKVWDELKNGKKY